MHGPKIKMPTAGYAVSRELVRASTSQPPVNRPHFERNGRDVEPRTTNDGCN
jgi:hypothetical protein